MAKRRRIEAGVKAKVALAAVAETARPANWSRPLASIRTKSDSGKNGFWRARPSCSRTLAAATPKTRTPWSRNCTSRSAGSRWSWARLKKKAARLD